MKKTSKKIISFSLYGNLPEYLQGVIRNAKLIDEIYPGWIMRVYAEKKYKKELENLNCEVIYKSDSNLHSGMFWRFIEAWVDGNDYVIFRDADSRLNEKEAVAVKAWIDSGLDAHCMIDHPHHNVKPISGGMWGIKGNILPRQLLNELLKECKKKQKHLDDMIWLEKKVYPYIKDSLLRHSSQNTKRPSISFPNNCPEIEGFIGQQFNKNNNPINKDGVLKRLPISASTKDF